MGPHDGFAGSVKRQRETYICMLRLPCHGPHHVSMLQEGPGQGQHRALDSVVSILLQQHKVTGRSLPQSTLSHSQVHLLQELAQKLIPPP